jgi:hypothetical protein
MSTEASSWTGVREGELESEFEQEFEAEGEGEGEEFLGGLGNMLGGLLGEGETTAESEFEDEFEGMGEYEGENFSFGGLFKKLGPILKKVAKVAAPMVGTAILGPAGGALGKLAANALGESEFEGEFELEAEGEFESEDEFEGEGEAEAAHEIASHAMTEHEALAEMMADAATHAAGEGEAEAMVGAAAVSVLSPRDRRALSNLLPDLLRGTAVLTRILRRNRYSRSAVRVVPTIVRRSIKQLKRQAIAGRPITRRQVARTTAREVRRVLGSRKLTGTSMTRNLRISRAVNRSRNGNGNGSGNGRAHRAIRG